MQRAIGSRHADLVSIAILVEGAIVARNAIELLLDVSCRFAQLAICVCAWRGQGRDGEEMNNDGWWSLSGRFGQTRS